MPNIKKFPGKKKAGFKASVAAKPEGELVNIDKKINEAIELRLGKFVKEIQESKIKQKKLEAYNKAVNTLRSDKKKKKGKKSKKK